MSRTLTVEELEARRIALLKFHCIRCYDVVRNKPKTEPCQCECHRERGGTP